MNYQIVKNKEELEKFIKWLPDLLPTEQYYITLLARKKYNKDCNFTHDKNQLKRVTATKDRIFQKLKQMECEIGSYTYEGEPISQDNLAVYITPNPRDLYKSGLNLLKEIANKVVKDEKTFNPQSLAMNVIQTTTSRKIYFDIDVDFSKEEGYLDLAGKRFATELNDHINFDCVSFIKTNGGLHCLIKLTEILDIHKKNWYNSISKMNSEYFTVTMNSDNLLPLPGCVQGKDFSPHFITFD